METNNINGGETTANPIIGSTGTINLTTPHTHDLTGRVHHLPCCIKFNGPCDVSNYFNPKSTGVEVDVEGGLEVKEAYFRGRNLQGVTVPLPQGYSGFILGKNPNTGKSKNTAGRGKAPEDSSNDVNNWETLAKCGDMTFWNHDSLPSRDDASLRLFHCFAVANALHEPVSAEELSQRI